MTRAEWYVQQVARRKDSLSPHDALWTCTTSTPVFLNHLALYQDTVNAIPWQGCPPGRVRLTCPAGEACEDGWAQIWQTRCRLPEGWSIFHQDGDIVHEFPLCESKDWTPLGLTLLYLPLNVAYSRRPAATPAG